MSRDFEIEIKGLNELKKALRDYPKISEPILQRAIIGTSAIFAKNTLKDDPVPYRTGFLLQSFRHSVGRLWARWTPTVKYARWVEEGTSPHKIPNAFGWRGFTANHPGSRANPYMEKILEKSKPEIDKWFVYALDKINAEIAKQVNLR